MERNTRKTELMQQSYFYLFRQMMSSFANRAANMMKCYDIHPSQAVLLLYVEEHKGKTQREISQALHVKPPTTAMMIKRMEKKDFLIRCQDEKDKRKSRIYITDYGREVCDFVRNVVVTGDYELNKVFTEEENCKIKEYMVRLILYFEEKAELEGYENQDCIFSGFED